MTHLAPALTEAVLARLGLSGSVDPSYESLAALYAQWCQRVPFDNIRKRAHLAKVQRGKVSPDAPLPDAAPEAFFEGWLAHGIGGSCWAGHIALSALLEDLGFSVERGLATMLVAPDIPPNHGTVVVRLDGQSFLVDASILTQQPLRLDRGGETRVEHPAWGVRSRLVDGHFTIDWQPMHMNEDLGCRIDQLGLSTAEFAERYEQTRQWGPFNYSLSLRLNRGPSVLGYGMGEQVSWDDRQRPRRVPVSQAERTAHLIEVVGVSEEMASQLPPDQAMPPPPPA